jgi:hypothetical protein
LLKWRMAWSHSLRFCFCPSKKEWDAERARVLKRLHVDIGEYPTSAGMTTVFDQADPKCIVTLADFVDSQPALLVGTIAHESLHVANEIFRSMKESNAGEETCAYTVGRISGEIFLDYIETRGDRLKELTRGG